MSKVFIETHSNIPCVVDVETTGLDCQLDNLIQVCVLPLDNALIPREDIDPFYVFIKPIKTIRNKSKAQSVHGITIEELETRGMDPWDAAERFDEWCHRLGLDGYRKIAPIAQNYTFDKGFLEEWLSKEVYNHRFHYHYRDTMNVAMFINDINVVHHGQTLYPRVSLGTLANHYSIENEKAHDALSDCLTEAALYRHLLQDVLPREIPEKTLE